MRKLNQLGAVLISMLTAIVANVAVAGPLDFKIPAVPKVELPKHEYKYVAFSAFRTPDNEFDYTTTGTTAEYQIEPGSGFDATFGLKQPNARIELTVIAEWNDVETLLANGVTPVDISGTISHRGVFLSKYWDIWFPFDAIEPYAGGGIGIVFTDFDISGPTTQIFDESARVLGLRAAAGASWDLNNRTEFFGEMRYRRYGTYDIGTATGGATDEFTLEDWGYSGGVRVSF